MQFFFLTKVGKRLFVFHFILENESNKSNRVSRKKEKKNIPNQPDNNPKQLENNHKQPQYTIYIARI
jgi:hypothetical protein